MIKKTVYLTAAVLFITFTVYAGNRNEIPMKPLQKMIQDGEYLRYSIFSSGKKTGSFYIVNKVNKKEKNVLSYMEFLKEDSLQTLPAHYTNFSALMKVSLENGSLVYYHENRLSIMKMLKEKGRAVMDLEIYEKSGTANYKSKIWDGFVLKTSSANLNIIQGYPAWNWNDVMFLGLRFLDADNPGFVCMVVPEWIKNPFLGRFVFENHEIVYTKTGKFNTVKFGWAMGNLFLSKLMEIFYKEYFFWMDEETGILVKETGNNNYSIELDVLGIWKE